MSTGYEADERFEDEVLLMRLTALDQSKDDVERGELLNRNIAFIGSIISRRINDGLELSAGRNVKNTDKQIRNAGGNSGADGKRAHHQISCRENLNDQSNRYRHP